MIVVMLALLVFVAFVLFSKKKAKPAISLGDNEPAVEVANYKRKRLLSKPEQVLYWRLKESLGDSFVLCAQVSFGAFLYVPGSDKNKWSKYGKARHKIADFVICSKDMIPLVIIELDDSSHDPLKDFERDRITKEAGIETLRFNVSNIPSIEELKKVLVEPGKNERHINAFGRATVEVGELNDDAKLDLPIFVTLSDKQE